MVSTQTLLHAVWLPPHPSVHLPATQLHVEFGGPPVHGEPHEPQFCASVWVSMHLPLQIVPVLHVHLPALQLAPLGQTLPQVPQFLESVWVLPHPPPSPGGVTPVSRLPPSGVVVLASWSPPPVVLTVPLAQPTTATAPAANAATTKRVSTAIPGLQLQK